MSQKMITALMDIHIIYEVRHMRDGRGLCFMPAPIEPKRTADSLHQIFRKALS